MPYVRAEQLIVVLALLCLGRAAWGITFSNAPKTIPVTGHPRGAALFEAINVGYQFDSDSVTTGFFAADTVSKGLSDYKEGLADLVLTLSRLDDSLSGQGWSQLPVAAYGLVATVPWASGLVLDRATLAAIWSGAISRWDDPAIAALNGGTSPATGDIVLVVTNHTSVADEHSSLTGVFARALASFDPEGFGAAYAASGERLLDTVLAAVGVARVIVEESDKERASAATSGMATTYALAEDATAAGLAWARLKNRYGTVVAAPTTVSLTSALTDFDPVVAEASLDVDIVDGAGAGSWPLAGIVFAVVQASVDSTDCTFTDAALTLLSWLQLNDGAISTLEANGLAPLTLGFRRRCADAVCAVTCNGTAAVSAAVFIGSGSPLPLWTGWSNAYDPLGGSFRLKYFESTQIIAGPLVRDYKIDFAGVVMSAVPAAYLNVHPDMHLIPVGIHSFSIGYNLPGVPRGAPPLVLSLAVLADIYLGVIESWDDERIVGLNPQLEQYLPTEPIMVVLNKGGPVTEAGGPGGGLPNKALAAMLSIVPGFAAAVFNGSAITYPVESTGRSILGGRSGFPLFVSNTTNSIGCFVYSSMSSFRAIRFIDLVNADGGVVSPTGVSLTEAATALSEIPDDTSLLVNAPGAGSWPMAQWDFVMVHSDTLPNCRKTTALLDWAYWTQSSSEAARLAVAEGSVVASSVEWMAPRVLASIANVRCPTTGLSAFSQSACVTFVEGSTDRAVMCSGHGSCTSATCSCDPGWQGAVCDEPMQTASSGSSDNTLAAALGGTLGGLGLLVLLVLGLACAIAAIVNGVMRRRLRDDADWEISIDDIELGPLLGRGGFGEVHRGKWRGTEVAVKTLPNESVSKADVLRFKDEVRVMTTLRHPNVVLFMAACTRPPQLCIVMELMALGSLTDLLDNEFVPQIPFGLKLKIAYQAAKGMHFLHSSGVVHRDLKSPNVLLDAKWNAKISDFGLTQWADSARTDDAIGTTHWSAPEVLQGFAEADLMLADVYAFGIVLWEILTRQMPYAGMSQAAIAVGVIRDGLRPPLSREEDPTRYLDAGDPMSLADCAAEYMDLVVTCWHVDPQMRPSFLEAMTRLSRLIERAGEASGSSQAYRSGTSSSSYSSHSGLMGAGRHVPSSSASSSSQGDGEGAAPWRHNARPPDGRVAIVFSDIAHADALWLKAPAAMRDATLTHNDLLRELAREHGGHEAILPRGSGEGTFCMAFADPAQASRWCATAQRRLLDVEWPSDLLECDAASIVLGHDADDRAIFRGLRVRMGMHVGHERAFVEHKTRRAEYRGPVAREALRLAARAQPGQVLLSAAAVEALGSEDNGGGDAHEPVCPVGRDDGEARLYQLRPRGLEGRLFSDDTAAEDDDASGSIDDVKHGTIGSASSRSASLSWDNAEAEVEAEASMAKHYVASANMVRWILNFDDIEIVQREPIGSGSYGVVYRGRWRNVDVAVKRFAKQRLTERRLLDFRAEVAFLSELSHHNVVVFVGACVHAPNLCVVTEFMSRGSLTAVLADAAGQRLSFMVRMRMLRSAASGVAYLHSLQPPIVHRDLKSSNLLVDEAYNVKVADFGLARIKEDNATMTRCGTPCWTAPEIIRGERYDEKADVYSFGIIAWEALTRRRPYDGANFMKVTMDVLEGQRPQLPGDCPTALARLIQACWSDNAAKRPSMEAVVDALSAIIGDDGDRPV